MLAFGIGLLKGGLGLAKALFDWLKTLSWSQLLCMALAGLCLLFYAQRQDARSDASRWEKQYHGERAAHIADRTAYADAQRQAAEQNRAEVARIEAEQERINDKARSDYTRDLARLRAGGVRKDIAAPQGSPGCPKASADGKAASRPDDEIVCVPRSLIVRAAEIELGRNALIDWINEQLKVAR